MNSPSNDSEPVQTDPYSGAKPLSPQHSSELLARVIDSCSNRVVVFDLDSTLLNNRPRSALIMREFAQAFDVQALANARADHWQDWSAATAMANIGLSDSQINAHLDNFEGFWQQRFFTSDYCAHDEQVPGAAIFVNRVAQAGGQVIYLTGRPVEMLDGTTQCLGRLGFPLPGVTDSSVELTMKPKFDGSDDDFKHQQASQLADNGNANKGGSTVAAAFDNEPQHINTYKSLLTNTQCIHLFTDHSMRRIPLQTDIPSIRDFTM